MGANNALKTEYRTEVIGKVETPEMIADWEQVRVDIWLGNTDEEQNEPIQTICEQAVIKTSKIMFSD